MELNQNEEFINAMPFIGTKALSFSTKTTQGIINFPEDYIGK